MKNKYIPRLVDEKIDKYLKVFDGVSIEGPKWCGKTWLSINKTSTHVVADAKGNLVMVGDYPILIDEWNLFPKLWEKVRKKSKETSEKGKYIITCSTKSTNEEKKYLTISSGAGRIGKIKMNTMSLYEMGASSGTISLKDLQINKFVNQNVDKVSIQTLAEYIVRGGFPSNINIKLENIDIIPKSYVDSILDKDIHDDKVRNKNKMLCLLKSLARNESSLVSNTTLLRDIEAYDDDIIESRITISDYINVLDRLNLLNNQNTFSENYRSSNKVGKQIKRHLIDTSLSCAILNLTPEKLLKDLNTFDLLFESLVAHDLNIYIDYLDGKLFHFRDNVTGLEVDYILEFNNGDYALVEVKLGIDNISAAKENLLAYYNNATIKPKFMCIIVGNIDYCVQDEETGIYIFPITALKP